MKEKVIINIKRENLNDYPYYRYIFILTLL